MRGSGGGSGSGNGSGGCSGGGSGGCRGGGNCRGCVLDHLGLFCSHGVPIGSVPRT